MRISLVVLLLVIILLRLNYETHKFKQNSNLLITARVLTEPRLTSQNQIVGAAGLSIFLPKLPEVSYGDVIKVSGQYIDGKLLNVNLLERREGKAILFALRRRLLDFYRHTLPVPHSSLISGAVMGSKKDLLFEDNEKLKSTGTSHIVVASGFNVTLVASFLLGILLEFTHRKRAIVISFVGVWVYILLAGFEAPLVRAGIMITLSLLAQKEGKLAMGINILILTVLVMLVLNPIWIFDIGFQLSVAATFSLILFESKVSRFMHFVPNLVRESLSTSIAAQIATAPLILFYFGRFNILSPLINALILWTIPIVTVVGMIAGIVGLIIPFLGKLIVIFLYPLTWWFWTVINFFAR